MICAQSIRALIAALAASDPTITLKKHRVQSGAMMPIYSNSMVPLLEHDDTVMLDCSQTHPSPPGIFILDDSVGRVAKRIEIIPSTTP